MYKLLFIIRVLIRGIVTGVLSAILVSSLAMAADFSDPTRPAQYKAAATTKSSLRLESILYSAERKVAIINGKALSEGDSIGALTVIRIEKESVSLSNKKQLVLKRASIRQEK